MCQEVLKVLKGKSIFAGNNAGMVNFAGKFSLANSSSYNVSIRGLFGKHSWIVDTGVSDHMTPHLDLLVDRKILVKPIKIGLPDGPIKKVTQVGDLVVCPGVILKETLYFPELDIIWYQWEKSLTPLNFTLDLPKMVAFFRTLLLGSLWQLAAELLACTGLMECQALVQLRRLRLLLKTSSV